MPRTDRRALGKDGKTHVAGSKREAYDRQPGDAFVIENFPDGHVCSERPSRDDGWNVRCLFADTTDRRLGISDLVVAPAVRAGRAQNAAEVEREHREPVRPGEFVTDGPQQRVVLAPTVARMRMTDHSRPDRGIVGEPEFPLQPDAILGRERHGFHLHGTMHAMTSIRQPAGTAFALRDPWPWADFAGLAKGGEAQGYRAVFLPEIQGRDAFASLTALAGETSTLLLGTGIVRMDARSPQLTAMAAATLQERSAGRGIIGIGTGPTVAGGLDRLRAVVLAVKAALRGAPAVIDGRPVTLSLIPESPPMVWISALGPRAVEVAGEVADGVLLNWCPPERVASVREQLSRGAERAGRDPADITVAGYIRASLGDDPRAASLALQEAAAEYASYPAYARQFDQVGLGGEALAAARAHVERRPEDVPMALIQAVTLLGSPASARSRLSAYRDAGLDLPVIYPVPAGPDPLASVRTTLMALAPAQGPSGS